MFAMLGTHPDIMFAVTQLAKFTLKPNSLQAHMGYAYYILHSLQGTKDTPSATMVLQIWEWSPLRPRLGQRLQS